MELVRPTLFVADLHGRIDGLKELLKAAGVVDPDGTRCHDVACIQMGDLANVVREDRAGDCMALDCALELEWFDLVLVGNHEHGFWDGPKFWGYDLMSTVADRIWKMDERGLWAPSFLVEEIDLLVTHAGWADDLRVSDGGGGWLSPGSAATAHEYLVGAWIENPKADIFSRIGPARGGHSMARCGGVLWSDWDEPKIKTFRQLVGHSTGRYVRRRDYRNDRWTICVDLNAKSTGKATGALYTPGSEQLEVITR